MSTYVQYSGNQGVMDIDSYIDNLDRAITLLWMRKDSAGPQVLGQFFDAQDTDNVSVKISNVGSELGLVPFSNDTEELPYDQPAPGRAKVYTLEQYRLAVQVTRSMIENDRAGKIMQMAGGLINSANRTLEYMRAALINGAFATTTIADATYMIADTHYNEHAKGSTFDNLGTGALTGANLQALVLLAQNMTDSRGFPSPREITKLAVPTALRQKAMELTTATLTAETSLNTPTVIIKGLPVEVSPHFTSATAYFGFGNAVGEEKGLMEFYHPRPSMANVGDNPVDIPIRKRIRFACEMAAYGCKNVFGSTGA